MIEYRHVYKAFDAPVLTGVSLAVAKGEIVSVVGPSGAGKSVLLKTTNGLITPDLGDVLIDGKSVYFSKPRERDALRRRVGYVFQYAALFDSMTVHENIAMGIHEEIARAIGEAEVSARVARALEDVNLDPGRVMNKLPSELSGGMRKRAGLARAIVGRPGIILYDEPVTGLDPVNSAAVSRLITEINRRLGVTSVLVTHDVPGALEISNRLALLNDGKLRFVGTPEAFVGSDDPLVRAFADRRVAAKSSPKMLEDTA